MTIDDEDTRQYPILVTETTVRVAWVSGTSRDEALRSAQYDWTDLIPGADTVSDLCEGGVSLPDEFEYESVVADDPQIGPAPLCDTCGVYWGGPKVGHDFFCPDGEQAAHRAKYPPRVVKPRAAVLLEEYAATPGLDGLESVDWDGYNLRFVVRPADLAAWGRWQERAAVEPRRTKVLHRYEVCEGDVRDPDNPGGWTSAVATALIGLGVPQLRAGGAS